METYQLPHSDIRTTRLGFGAWPIAGGFNWGPQDEKDSKATLKAAYESGINFYDTARGYGGGKSEQLISEELGPIRDKIVLASKVSPDELPYDKLKEACHDRLKMLKTDYLDLLQIHWPNWEVEPEEVVKALEELKEEGKIRAYGVSNYGKKDLTDIINAGAKISSNQLPYNLLWRAVEFDAIPTSESHQVPVLCYMPIMQGMLAGKFNNADQVPEDRARTRHFSKERPLTRHHEAGCEALTFETIEEIRKIADEVGVSMANLSMAWLLLKSPVANILVGARNEQQVRRNMEAIEVKLNSEIISRLDAVTNPLKEELGSNPDMWQDVSDSRFR